jgi:hypothetical protein
MPEGIIHNLPMQDYHQEQSYSKSDLVNAERSPDYVLKMREKPKAPSAAMAKGSAVHLMLLEPEKVDDDLVVAKCGTRRGKVWDKAFDENPGKIIILESEMPDINAMVQSARHHPIAKDWLGRGHAEASCFCEFEADGFNLPVKCRPDLLPGELKVVDVKTASDVTPGGFGRAAYNFRYHWSAYLTNAILAEITGHPHTYYFLAIENQFPFECVIYEAFSGAIDLAESELSPIMARLAMAHNTGIFKKITEKKEILGLSLPYWAIRRLSYEP